MNIYDALETLSPDELREILREWDPEWIYHYAMDEGAAMEAAVRYDHEGMEKILKEYLRD